MNTKSSKEIFVRAKKAIPGGVNSPVRAFQSVNKEYPIFIKAAKGCKLYDEDGNEYIDMIYKYVKEENDLIKLVDREDIEKECVDIRGKSFKIGAHSQYII